jgi:hypothetical protein
MVILGLGVLVIILVGVGLVIVGWVQERRE